MGAIVSLLNGSTHTVEHFVVGERSEYLVVAFTGLMDAGEDRVHNTEPCAASDASARSARTVPSALAADSSARTTLVPIAMTRPDLDFAASIAAAHECGMR
jgi:hypothetical protein